MWLLREGETWWMERLSFCLSHTDLKRPLSFTDIKARETGRAERAGGWGRRVIFQLCLRRRLHMLYCCETTVVLTSTPSSVTVLHSPFVAIYLWLHKGSLGAVGLKGRSLTGAETGAGGRGSLWDHMGGMSEKKRERQAGRVRHASATAVCRYFYQLGVGGGLGGGWGGKVIGMWGGGRKMLKKVMMGGVWENGVRGLNRKCTEMGGGV